ncbi:MAG: spore coat protein [Bacilli bacterium]|nr:spore coat protein [Bacilli bacterium]MBP3635549.1 spore coat protein [Bacilli bacterium]
MNNNKVQNPKTEVPATIEMNDENYLNDMLETEKNMSVNMTIALNEASNEVLFGKIYEMFLEIKKSQRNLFELAFKNGWYCLEKAEQNKISEEYNKLSTSLNQLQQ